MRRLWLLIIVAGLVTAGAAPANAQNRLEDIARKNTLSEMDKAFVAAEVSDWVNRLTKTGKSQQRRSSMRDKMIRTAQMADASDGFRAVYAEACASELASVAAGERFETAFDAVMILVSLDHPNAVGALTGALFSKHPAVRYTAARALRALHVKVKDDRVACRKILRTLGHAGAAESEALVLSMIYRGIYFQADVPDFPLGDKCAKALNVVFASRTKKLANGSRDETRDRAGFDAAVACYASADPARQAELIGHMAAFLSHAVDRYYDPDTSPDYHSTLTGLIRAVENAIHAMIKSSNASPPGDSVAGKIKSDGLDGEQAVRAALAQLIGDSRHPGVLNGPPWNLP